MPLKSPPTVPGHWLWRNWRDFNNDSLHFVEKAATIDDIVTLRFGPLKGYFVNHPDYIHDILTVQSSSFNKPSLVQRALSDITGENIFTGNGDFWRQRRKIMQPAFHAQRIRSYHEIIVEKTLCELQTWQDGSEIEINAAMMHLTMNIVVKTMFGADINDDSSKLGQIFMELFQLVYQRMSKYALIPSWLPISENRQIRHRIREIRQIIRQFIADHRADAVKRDDLLSMLLSAHDEHGKPLDDDEIIREALTIFAAGYETTAYTITFALYTLAKNPAIATKLTQGITQVLGQRTITLQDLPRLTCAEMVIKETLRLYPTAWGFSRATTEPVTLGDYHLPANSVILISPWAMGRDARWFSEPLSFKPDRFHPDVIHKIPRYAYIPFGGGARICIGNQFAMMEAQIIIVSILQQYSLHISPDCEIRPYNAAFTLRSDQPVMIRVHKRQHNYADSEVNAEKAIIV